MDIPFVKMHGAGNDFVMVDDREGIFPEDAGAIAGMASRGTGIGCEGVILVQKSAIADFKMRFFNPDGTEAELCGNGARCVAAFARDIGAVTGDRMRFETLAGEIRAEIVDAESVKVWMPTPKDLREDFVNSGVPHKIVPVDAVAAVEVEKEGRRIRHSPEFAPAGTNVDFVAYHAPHAADIRTYERGVEAESGACGTGAVAAAVVGVAQHGLIFPVEIRTAMGFTLTIGGETDGKAFYDITLTGPVKRVFKGKITLDSIDKISK